MLKDFATDADELKLKRAAHSMSSTLSARLAVATCKEPLCNTIIETIRMQVAQANLPEVKIKDMAMYSIMLLIFTLLDNR